MFNFEIKANTYVYYDSEVKVHVASCPELNLISQGETEEEAERAIQSAINLFVITCYEHDILHSTLKRLQERSLTPEQRKDSRHKEVRLTIELAA